MTTPTAACGVCGSPLDIHVLTFPRLPAYLVPLPLDLAPTVERADLNVSACATCGHLQVPNADSRIQRLIYEEYYSHYSVDSAEALIPHYRQPFEEFLTQLHNRNLLRGTVLEVGCSSGKAIPLLRRYFTKYCGIDPSDRIRTAEKLYPDCEFITGFFPEAVADRTFNAVVSQFNLEHMLHPGAFLEAVRRVSAADTLVILQVPNAEDAVRRGWPCFVAHEHVHYFRTSTLEKLLMNHGFTPLHWGQPGASLTCAAVISGNDFANAERYAETEPLALALRQKQLAAQPPEMAGDKFLFYGVGPILHWCLLHLPHQARVTVIDDNPAYSGMGVPGYGTVVRPLTPNLLQSTNTVHLTLNDIYYPVVQKKLRTAGFTGEVLGIVEGRWQAINN